ncbi:hypothetical protein DFQ04_1095 [Algoriphagus boseongensis]|uniref:LPXTG-motif cell wall-anchored protein n=1 Tax=Algoriphagus boseongensis TaxID=1442587 RepID=A0A4R6TCU9_9BACT|nr:hypothetical protein [Algoriphagus boseongensis]TDQ19274.1 hypothetical protein DFQ04_1095 [Algoriphagus boseongensis]
MRILGVILIVIGIAMFFSSGISFTTKEKVIDAGPIQISADKQNNIAWPSYAGGVVAVAGVFLVLFGKKK